MQAPDKVKRFIIPAQSLMAANQDFVNEREPASALVGWDPFEVWQRMIKEPRERRLFQQR